MGKKVSNKNVNKKNNKDVNKTKVEKVQKVETPSTIKKEVSPKPVEQTKIKKETTKSTKETKTSKKSFFDIFKFVFKEIFLLIKSIFDGFIGLFDMLFSGIVSVFTYISDGANKMGTNVWKFGLQTLLTEIGLLIVSFFAGIKAIFLGIFHDLPHFIDKLFNGKVSKFFTDLWAEISKEWLQYKENRQKSKTLSKGVSNYVTDKYKNSKTVKNINKKKESKLKEFKINPNSDDVVRTKEKRVFKYVAKNKDGLIVTGFFAAFSKLDVFSYLTDEGFTVYSIVTNKLIEMTHKETLGVKRKMANKDLIFWLAQLSTYVKAGIPLTDAVKILAKQDKRSKYRAVYDSLIYELTMGETFSEALLKQGQVFPQLLINMVKSAEMIGKIEDTLDEMSDYYQEIEDTKKAIISAITYPAVVLVFAIGVIIFMLVYIIPKFTEVFESMDAEIPAITQFALDLSDFLKNNYIVIILSVIGAVAIFIILFKNVKSFKKSMQKFAMKLPVIGKLMIYKEMTLFASTFATLNKNNVMLTDSMEILSKITGNEIYKEIMINTINNLIKGDKMSETFKDHWAIPDLAYYMILTGEGTGELSTMLEKVGEYYSKEEKVIVGQIKTFIEPVLILGLAGAVGFIVISVLVPMFSMYQTIS